MRISWMIIGLLGLLLAPSTARAIEVMCQNEQGVMCTLANEPDATYECTCDGQFLEGTTGGSENPWADLTEAELLVECEALLPAECALGESTTTGGTGNSDETGPVTGTPDTNPTTDPSGPASDGTVGEGGDEENDGDDDDDKGCSVGGHGTALAPWLAVIVACTWRRRATTTTSLRPAAADSPARARAARDL